MIEKKISELRPGMEHIDLEVRIEKLDEPREIVTSYDAEHTIVDGEVKDDTGRINLAVWNETIEQLEEVSVGDEVKLRNCFISSYKGSLSVNVGRDSMIIKIK